VNKATPNDSWVQNPDGTPGYTENIITGCDLNHDYCFARKLANGRLRAKYRSGEYVLAPAPRDLRNYDLDPFYPRFWPNRLKELDRWLTSREKPVGVFLNIMGDWGCPVIPRKWLDQQFELIGRHPRHRFYLLTHHPQVLSAWSPFPLNCYIGVTANADGDMTLAVTRLMDVEAGVRFVSMEPMVGFISLAHNRLEGAVEWVIIGAMTCDRGDLEKLSASYLQLTPMPWGRRYTLQPRIEWVAHVVRFADEAGVPVFLKDNLMPLLATQFSGKIFIESHNLWAFKEFDLRQEMPRD
jgi:protein gp37